MTNVTLDMLTRAQEQEDEQPASGDDPVVLMEMVRLYDLRHTAATIALVAGVSPKVISEQLGHASVAFTLDVYSHVLPHMQDRAASVMQAILLS